jgi:hypothetical protein
MLTILHGNGDKINPFAMKAQQEDPKKDWIKSKDQADHDRDHNSLIQM